MEDLGMTGYEIRVYTSLLEVGAITAADISKRSGVPYSKIYEVLILTGANVLSRKLSATADATVVFLVLITTN